MLQWLPPERTLDGKYRILIREEHWPLEQGLGCDFNQEKDAKLAIQLVRAFEATSKQYKESEDGTIPPQQPKQKSPKSRKHSPKVEDSEPRASVSSDEQEEQG